MDNQELKRINNSIDELFKKWKSAQPLRKEYQERFDKKVRLDWNYHSNHIEGNTLTYSETKALLDEGKEEGIHPPRDYKEMKAHDLAINKVRELAKDKERRINEVTIRDLNQIILKEPFWKEAVTSDGQKTKIKIIPGQYKTQPNHVITEEGKIFKFAEPHDAPIKMQELMDWFNKEMEKPSLSIASFLAELHHKFIVIHPFDDGNGRIARLWINYVLLMLDYPSLVIKSEDKRNYFAALQRADHGDIDMFAIYLGKVLISWLELGIKAGKGEDISDPSDVDKEVELFVREQKHKGLNKYFSKETAINVIDNLWEVLFEPFKNKFEDFYRLFNETKIKQIIDHPELSPMMFYPDSIDSPESGFFENKEDIKEYWSFLNNKGCFNYIDHVEISIELDCISYKAQYSDHLKKPFNMKTKLLLELGKFEYKINISSSIDHQDLLHRVSGLGDPNNVGSVSELRHYNQLLTEKEANKFIAKGKGKFLELLKSAAGKEVDDKK